MVQMDIEERMDDEEDSQVIQPLLLLVFEPWLSYMHDQGEVLLGHLETSPLLNISVLEDVFVPVIS